MESLAMTETPIQPASLRKAFSDKSVLVTGHTGFKGAWLCLWLYRLGAHVSGYSIDVPTTPSLFDAGQIGALLAEDQRGDITYPQAVHSLIREVQPDVIFHLAAQSLVRRSYEDPIQTMATNVMGTITLLDAVRQTGRPCSIVIVTSDKCYENTGQVWGYREADPLGGHDPYSASKAMAEIAAATYRRSFFPVRMLSDHGIGLATVRSGNVLGGGDWSQDRIAVDLVKGFANGEVVTVRNPRSIRPWQHVLDPLLGYLTVAAGLQTGGTGAGKYCSEWNFGPSSGQSVDVGRLAKMFAKGWGRGAEVIETMSVNAPAEAAVLRLAIDKAVVNLGWSPRWDVDETVARTVSWYKRVLCEGADAQACCLSDLEAHEQLAD